MSYLGITVSTRNKKEVNFMSVKYKKYSNTIFKIYKSQIKITATEKKRWTYFLFMDISKEVELYRINEIINITKKFKSMIIRAEIFEEKPNDHLKKTSFREGVSIIEHVNVRKNKLKVFKKIMDTYNTPAMDYIIKQKKWCNEFFSLETSYVIYHDDLFSIWNQIHIINMNYSAPFHYKKDFSEGLKKSGSRDFENIFFRLSEIREFTYKYKCKTYTAGIK